MFKTKLATKTLSVAAIAVFTFFALASGDDKKAPTSNGGTSSETTATTSVPVGQPLQTEYFAVTVNKVSVRDRVNTGNEFADLKPEQGNKNI